MTAGTIAPLAVAGTCELVWVDGPDAASFLQGLLTNDVAALAAGGSCSCAHPRQQGPHPQCDAGARAPVRRRSPWLPRSGDGEPILALLDEYHFSEDVDIIGPEVFAAVTVVGRSRRRSPAPTWSSTARSPAPPTSSGSTPR